MTITVVLAISALVVMLSVFVYLTLKNMREVKNLRSMSDKTAIEALSTKKMEKDNEKIDFRIQSESGEAVLECYEITRFPKKAIEVESSSELAKRSTHLISDIVKGSIGIPNKTVEVVFKPEITKGLKEGTYVLMQTKNGETLADAVDAAGKKIVGKGRIVEGGKLKQLSVGAFNLLSIAVAQSHLASIESSLSDIKGQLKDIKDKLSANDYSELKGAIDYYTEIKDKISLNNSPSELSENIANSVEILHKDSHTWRNKIFKDFEDLIDSVKALKDLDTFGTENTFKKLMELIKGVERISERYALLLQLSLISKAVLYYVDPSSKKFTPLKVEMETWHKHVDDFENAIYGKATSVLTKAVWNESSTLESRKNNILLQAKLYRHEISDNAKWFADSYARLESNMSSMFDAGEIKLALEFDSNGDVSRTALLS